MPNYSYKLLLELYKIFTASIKEDRIILMGDSAGGGLGLGVAQQLRRMNVKQPSELIMISPFLDAAMSSAKIDEVEPRDIMLGSYGLRRCGELQKGYERSPL